MALAKAKEIISSSPVTVFSKTNCGHCKWVKELLTQLGASFKVIELDLKSDGADIQSVLTEWTGQKKLPIVFVGGNHIGGCESSKDFFTRMLQALEDASIVMVGQKLDVIEKFKLSMPDAVDTIQMRSSSRVEKNNSTSSEPVIDSEDQEFSDDDRNHKHRKREAQTNSFDNDVQEFSVRTNRKRSKPLETRRRFLENDSSNVGDICSRFQKRQPLSTPGMQVPSDLGSRARLNQTFRTDIGRRFDTSSSIATIGRPPVGRGRGRSTVSWSQQDSKFSPLDTLDFASHVSQGLPTHHSMFVGTGRPNAASTQNASWGAYGFVHGMNNSILDPLQSLGLQSALQPMITPLFNMAIARQRCGDFDERGFCLRGDMCPMEHGVNRIVVEDVQSLSQFNLPVSDPSSHALGIQARAGSLPSVSTPSGLFTSCKSTTANDGKSSLIGDALKLSGVSSASGVTEADVYDPDQPLLNNEHQETSSAGLMLPSPNNDEEPMSNADSSAQQNLRLCNAKSEQANRTLSENIGSQGTNSSVWGRISHGSRSEMGIRTNSNLVSMSYLSDEMKEDNEKSTINTSADPEKCVAAEDMGKKPTMGQSLPRLHADSGRNSGRMSQKASRTLYVHGIPQQSNTRDAILSHFKKFGEVVDIYIPLNSEKAFVQFSKREEAEAALKAPDAVMGNRFIKLWWANRDRVPDVRKNSIRANLLPSFSLGVSSFPSQPSDTDKEKGELTSPVPSGSKRPTSEILVSVTGFSKSSSAIDPKIAPPVQKKLEGLELLKEELRKKQESLAQKRDEFRRQLDKYEKQAISVKKGEVASEQVSKKHKVDMDNEAAPTLTHRIPFRATGAPQKFESTLQKKNSGEVLVSPTSRSNSTILQKSSTDQTSQLSEPKSNAFNNSDDQPTSFRILPPLPDGFTDVAVLQDHFSLFGDLTSVVLEDSEERNENEGIKTPENFSVFVTFMSCDSAERAYVGGRCWQGHSLRFMWLNNPGNSNKVCAHKKILASPGSSSADIQADQVMSMTSVSTEENSANCAISKLTAVINGESSRNAEDVHCAHSDASKASSRASHSNTNKLSCEECHPMPDVSIVEDKFSIGLAQ